MGKKKSKFGQGLGPTGYEKRDHIARFLNFHFKTLITWKV